MIDNHVTRVRRKCKLILIDRTPLPSFNPFFKHCWTFLSNSRIFFHFLRSFSCFCWITELFKILLLSLETDQITSFYSPFFAGQFRKETVHFLNPRVAESFSGENIQVFHIPWDAEIWVHCETHETVKRKTTVRLIL